MAPSGAQGLDAGGAQALAALLAEGESPHTISSYQAALRYWEAWVQLRYRQALALPLPAAVVLQFVVDHVQHRAEAGLQQALPPEIDQALVASGAKGKPGPLALSTVIHRLAVLSKLHQVRQLPNPCQDAEVRHAITMARKAYARRGERAQKKAALTRAPLELLLDTCDNSLAGKRDRALLLFAWASGGRRRSEVAGATLEQLHAIAPGQYLYELSHSKTNQTGRDLPENRKPIVGVAGRALADWLATSGIAAGPLFRRIYRNGRVGSEALTPVSVSAIVKQRCALAGVEGDFSAHSLRSGFVTEAGRQSMPLADTMALTGHRSVQSVLGYFRAESPLHNPAGKLLESD
ncbi:MAG: site-specific integrase [Comamonas sp.]